MPLVDELVKFRKNLKKVYRDQLPKTAQTSWVKVKSVDWDKKTMVATGVIDDLDYYDVLLGLGSIYLRPTTGSLCLVGLVENNPSATCLIHAKQVEEISIIIVQDYTVSSKNIDFSAEQMALTASEQITLNAGENIDLSADQVAITGSEQITLSAGESIDLSADQVVLTGSEQITLNGSSNGGILINEKAENNLDKLKDYAETLKTATRTAIAALETLAGSPGTIASAFETAMTPKIIVFEDMQNSKVKH